MSTTTLVALITAVGMAVAGAFGFIGRLLIERPNARHSILLADLAYLSKQVPELRDQVALLTKQLSEEKGRHLIELAERDATIAALSVRVSELERREMTPAQRSAEVRRQQAILDKPDHSGGD